MCLSLCNNMWPMMHLVVLVTWVSCSSKMYTLLPAHLLPRFVVNDTDSYYYCFSISMFR